MLRDRIKRAEETCTYLLATARKCSDRCQRAELERLAAELATRTDLARERPGDVLNAQLWRAIARSLANNSADGAGR